MTHYNQLSLLAFAVLVVLVLMQVNWLYKAVISQTEETHQKLQRLIPEMAMAVNGIDHDLFHGASITLNELPLAEVSKRIDSILAVNKITNETHYAIYQDTLNGLFKTNAPEYQNALMESDIKSCLTCIVSFSIAKKEDPQSASESDEAYRKRISQNSTFEYFSPVSKLNIPNGKTLWLSVYQPHTLSDALKSLIYLFVISVLLLALLLYLFHYLITSLSRHKKLSQVKDDFFNNMTHEFKTPLSSIRLASKVLRQSRNREKNESYHQLIEKESQLLETQIDQLLMLSLLDNKGLALNWESLDLHEIIHDIPARLKPLMEEKNASLMLDLQLEPAEIQGDYDHLSNSICNLIENSLKYSNEKVKIWISTYLDQNKKVIRVRDNGPGISPMYQAQIFDRFFRAKKDNQYKGQGFGIGLSYVKSIIEAHKGSITLNENYTDGCEFIIKL